MKLRAKWLSIAPMGFSLRKVSEAMLGNQYGKRRASGFRLEEVRREYVLGSFVERLEWDDSFADPSGTEFYVHRIEVRQVRFRLANSEPHLELIDSPRSLASFVEQLSNCAELSIRLIEPSLAPDEWLRALERRVGKMTVTHLTAIGLILSASASASISLTGTEDIRRFRENFFSGQPGRVERLTACTDVQEFGKFELMLGGRATVFGGGSSMLEILREGIKDAL